jgi:hypothetical protein
VQRVGQNSGSASAPNPVVRGVSVPSVPEVIRPDRGETVSVSGVEFRWKPVEGAREYEINVVTAAGDLVWKGETKTTAASLPSDVKLIPGRKYFVWIRADLLEDKAVQSRAVPFIASNP